LQKGNVKMGLPYLQSSANMGDFGVLSQLSLGSAYGTGAGGVPKSADLSRHYNALALTSIQNLQSNGSPDAQRVLSALPASPDKMIQSLSQSLKSPSAPLGARWPDMNTSAPLGARWPAVTPVIPNDSQSRRHLIALHPRSLVVRLCQRLRRDSLGMTEIPPVHMENQPVTHLSSNPHQAVIALC